jgi:N-acetylglucosaminyl-diphospho-decaprenol L-rhamnosyltransferase
LIVAPTLDILIVNWNAGLQLRTCLQSIVIACHPKFALQRVVVVDNASSDGSVDDLSCGEIPLELIPNKTNTGFAAACNQAAHGGQADFLLFLNPDTRLLPDSLSAPLEFLSQPAQQRVGILGIELLNDRGEITRTCARFPTARLMWRRLLGLDRLSPKLFPSYRLTNWDHTESRDVDHVIGAFYLVRRAVWETLGGFDERFFVYLEDLDFSYRAHLAGWKTHFMTETQAFHRGGSTAVSPLRRGGRGSGENGADWPG